MKLKSFTENDHSRDQTQRLAENLRALFKKHNLNANQLSQELPIPKMTIGRLLSGETTDPRVSTLKLIADYFNVSLDYLIGAEEQSITRGLKPNKPYFIPKLDWEMLKKINDISKFDFSRWEAWQSVSLGEQQISKNAFALESRPSMYPRFPHGTIFILDPDIIPMDGDIVLIKLKSNNEFTLRELIIDPPEWQLHPVVAGSTILYYSKAEHQIVGVNVLTMLFNRKEFEYSS